MANDGIARASRSQADADALLRVEGLHKQFVTRDGPVIAVEEMSFSVAPGEFVSIIGPSG